MQRNRLSWILIALALLIPQSSQADSKVVPGRRPPASLLQALKPWQVKMDQALEEKSPEDIQECSQAMMKILGPWAGNPGRVTFRDKTINKTAPTLKALNEAWPKLEALETQNPPWKVSPKGEPQAMTQLLRAAAWPLRDWVETAWRTPVKQRAPIIQKIKKAGEYLLRCQRDSGLFAAPDLRKTSKNLGAQQASFLKQHPKALNNGWITQDKGEGFLDYDHALCALALTDIYELTRQPEYRKAAIQAALWSGKRRPSRVWAQNAVSVWVMARVGRVAGDKELIESAREWTRLYVLPGQCANGRWLDGVSAQWSQHGKLCLALIEVWRGLDKSNALRKQLEPAIEKALDKASTDTLKNGAASSFEWIELWVTALRYFRAKKAWNQALVVQVNSGLRFLKDRRAARVGVSLVYYWSYRQTVEASAKPKAKPEKQAPEKKTGK